MQCIRSRFETKIHFFADVCSRSKLLVGTCRRHGKVGLGVEMKAHLDWSPGDNTRVCFLRFVSGGGLCRRCRTQLFFCAERVLHLIFLLLLFLFFWWVFLCKYSSNLDKFSGLVESQSCWIEQCAQITHVCAVRAHQLVTSFDFRREHRKRLLSSITIYGLDGYYFWVFQGKLQLVVEIFLVGIRFFVDIACFLSFFPVFHFFLSAGGSRTTWNKTLVCR